MGGDRLDPQEGLPDVHQFETAPIPFSVKFWRTSVQSRLLHRSPMWEMIGITMFVFAIDLLHCVDLGILQRLYGFIVWLCITYNLFVSRDLEALLSPAQCQQAGIDVLKGKILNYYRARRGTPEAAHTELHDLTSGMLGSREHPNFDAKGGETRCLLPFFVGLVREISEQLPLGIGPKLVECVDAVANIYEIIEAEPRDMPEEAQRRLSAYYLRHVRLLMECGCELLPKHHLFWHCLCRIPRLGNPKKYSTYFDENENKWIARVARSAHRLTFPFTIYQKFRRSGRRLGLW